MRIRRLDLARYGKFTDKVLDFGPKIDGKPDLHIIYGPNEAGKSTTLSAFLDLMFGIETRSRYNFLHPYPTMRIGGTLEIAGAEKQFIRIKRPQNSLLDAREQPIAEAAILGELGGIDRDAYRTMFSLDDETLEMGGESILASHGDLGQLLFSASTGLADLGNRLVEIRAQADAFYKFRARSGELATLKERLAQLKAEREAIDTLASDHALLVTALEQATRQYDDAVSERGRSQRRLDEIRRLLSVLPRLAALREIRNRLEPLSGVRPAPPGWSEELPDLRKQEIELGVRMRTLEADIERLQTEIASIVVDETALGISVQFERLSEPRARFLTAEKDLPERRMQLREADAIIAGLLLRIERSGEPDPSRLILGASVTGRLRELIENRSGVETALDAAERELADARDDLERSGEALRSLTDGKDAGFGPSIPALRAALTAARAVDFTGRRRAAEGAFVAARDQCAARQAALHPWRGEETALSAMQPPHPDAIAQMKTAQEEIVRQIARRSEDAERLASEVLVLEAELSSASEGGHIASDRQAAEARAAREAAWSAHRSSLDPQTAATFETALRADDIVGASRLAHAAELAKLTARTQSLAVRKAEAERVNALLESSRASLSDLGRQVSDMIGALAPALDPAMTLAQFEAWLARRLLALEAAGARADAEREFRQAETDEQAIRTRLADALQATGRAAGDEPLEQLMAVAQDLVDREASLAGARQALEASRQAVEARERALARARSADEAWQEAWREACAASWLGERDQRPRLPVVREVLALLQQLEPALEKRRALADRIEKMEKDRADFGRQVEDLSATLALKTSRMDSLADFAAAEASVQRAESARQARIETEERLGKALDEQRALRETAALHARRKAEMTAFYGVASLDEVAGRLADAGRRADLQIRSEDAEREILETLGLGAICDAELMLDAADRPALEIELAELEQRATDLDRRCQELYAEKTKATDRLAAVGGDARVAAIEETRRTTLLELEDGAARYLRLRLGILAAEHALRLYREQHRSSMMLKASEAFNIVSRGAYSGLATQPDKETETLIAISPSGSKQAEELSKGTRFQLYLALRVAGYHEFVRANGPLPFIADDIMETFDDFRAEEAFRLFSDMAGMGQVIYLTHHRHLCEIARKICPDAREYEI